MTSSIRLAETTTYRQPWLGRPSFDLALILSPPFLCLLVVAFLPESYKQTTAMPVAAWVLLVLFVDVAHVYSTLFRTYMNPRRFAKQKNIYIAIPVICYVAGVLLYSTGGMVFWSILAYLAVFHFIRQQYGFMRLYSRTEQDHPLYKKIDTITIYTATLYPIMYWHLSPGRNFNWFIEGDFLSGESSLLLNSCTAIYLAIIIFYCIKEVIFSMQRKQFNIPRNLIIFGTLLSWYFGIVYFNGDLTFTMLNVISHGIPYMALIWLTEKKEALPSRDVLSKQTFSRSYGWVLFVGFLILLAYLEEGLWDGFIWKEHDAVFGLFNSLPKVSDIQLLAFIVPLLALPQMTHYVLDGFIWRRKDA